MSTSFSPRRETVATRRAVLTGLATLPLLGRAARAQTVALKAGDQKGGTEAVMKAAGALSGLPYQLEWKQFAAAAPLLEALNANAIDLAFAGDAPATFALAAGLPARIIAPTRATGASTAIVVQKESPIRTIADLRGRRIAANRGSIAHALVLAVAEREGWAEGDIKLANLLPSDAKMAFATGAVDAWGSWNTYIAQARLVDGARVIVDGGNGLLTGLSYLLATDRAIAERRAALVDFSRRLAAARRWAEQHRHEYAAVLAREIGVTPEVALLAYETDLPMPVPIDAAVISDQQKTADRYTKARIIPAHLDASRMFDPSFNEALAG